MTATTLWDALDGLEAALRDSAELTALRCPISQGWPSRGPQKDRQIWIPAEVDDLDTVADVSGSAGVGRFEERYQLRVYAIATVPADRTFRDWRHRIRELIDPVLDAVRSDQQLGGAVHLATPGQISVGESFADQAHRHLNAVIWIRVQAYVC